MSTALKTKSGCGCGGGGKTSARGDCGCGCGKARPACPETGFSRPRFFAGQLLTEDDLEGITGYLNAKSRLRNRHLFGQGVVCGLEVRSPSQPTRDGNLVIEPGYALDCCGNDIVLPCPFSFNIHDLIRDQKLLCPTTCPGPDDKSLEFLLYISYDEQGTDLITPYSPDGSSSCENSRVTEGCSFLVRCAPHEDPPDDGLLGRVEACRKTALSDDESDDLLQLQKVLGRYATLKAASATAGGPLSAPDVKLVAADATALAAAPAALGALDLAPADASVKDPIGVARTKLAASRETIRAAMRTYARFVYAGSAAWSPLAATVGGGVDIGRQVGILKTALNDLQTKFDALNKVVPDKARPHPWSDAFSTTLASWRQVALPTAADGSAPASVLAPKTSVKLADWLLVLDGDDDAEPYTFDRYRGALQTFNDVRERAIDLLGSGSAVADPHALHDIAKVAEPKVPDKKEDESHWAESLDKVGNSSIVLGLREAVSLSIERCFCEAINPPCPPCEDTAVLLARVTIRGCVVFSICNLVRTIVVSPAALQYWLPIQPILQALCCGRDRLRDGRDDILRPVATLRDAANELLGPRLEKAPTGGTITRE